MKENEMKILLSVNKKFFKKNPNELINYINENDVNKLIKGFEFAIDFNNINEKNYLLDFAYLCKKYNYNLQLHGSNFEIGLQEKYLDYCNQISNIMGKNINIVVHPFDVDDLDNTIKKTNKYFRQMLDYINNKKYNLKIGIENLNSTNIQRLSKVYLKDILVDNPELKFTYDVGHEIVNHGNLVDLDKIHINRINNVHIHTYDKYGNPNDLDHKPIRDGNLSREWVIALNYLKKIKYTGPLVLEYDLYCLGSTINEQLDNYIKCAIYIRDYL